MALSARNHLPGTVPVGGKPQPIHNIIQTPLHDAQQHFAGVFGRAGSQLEITPELALEDPIKALQLLLLTQACQQVPAHFQSHWQTLNAGMAQIAKRLKLEQVLIHRGSERSLLLS